jgi:FG-GAP-like repeat
VVTYDGWAGIADVNGDGIPDVITASLGSGAPVTVYLGKGDGTFGPPIAPSFTLCGPAVFADFNGDGKMDMALNSDQGRTGYVALGNGDGTFQTPVRVIGVDDPAAAADLNGDGIPDLVGYSATSKQTYLAVALGHGDGTFGQASLHPLQYGFDLISSTVVITDWNGDGHLDIAAMPGPYGLHPVSTRGRHGGFHFAGEGAFSRCAVISSGRRFQRRRSAGCGLRRRSYLGTAEYDEIITGRYTRSFSISRAAL